MSLDDKVLAIAARIADGTGIDWPTDDSMASGCEERAVLEELKAIAALAAFHRTPTDWPAGELVPAIRRWGPLTIIAPIGHGRFGQVYRAWEPRLQRHVALKLLHSSSPSAAASPTRAIEEARLLARVRHPNVLTVYGAECLDGEVGICTEFIEGRTLESLLAERGRLRAGEVVTIGLDLCRALAAVHEAGLLHRDIKAQNVMRETGGRIVLLDFGTGYDLELRPAREGDLSGTPLYLAPELFAGGQPNVASDLYALAVLLFYLSMGRYPTPGRTFDDVRAGHRNHQPSRRHDTSRELPTALGEVVERGLAVNPSERYPNAGALGAALERARAQLIPPQAGPATPPQPTPWRAMSVLALGVSLVTIAIFGWSLHVRRPGPSGPVESVTAMPTPAVRPPVSGVETTQAPQRAAAAGGAATPHEQAVPDTSRPEVVKVTLPPFLATGLPSHDGRFLPYIDANSDVQILEVKTGRSHRLTDAGQSGEKGLVPLMSPDGTYVAYAWSLPDGGYELRASQSNGTWPHVVIAHETAYVPVPTDWSRDGRDILCWFRQKDGTADLVLVPVESGQPRLLQTFANSPRASLSPDGRFVVTPRGVKGGPPYFGDLLIMGTDGSEPHVLLKTVANDRFPMWTPNGNVFFVRDSPDVPNSSDGWIVPVVDGFARGDAARVAANLGSFSGGPGSRVALTDNGRLYRILSSTSTEIYTASIDLTGSAPAGPPTRISQKALGDHVGPAWSPDGRSLAYFTVTSAPAPGAVPLKAALTIQDMSSGATQVLRPRVAFLGGYSPRWTPDGGSVIVWAADQERPGRLGYYRVDIHSSATRAVVLVQDGAQGPDTQPPVWQCSAGDFLYLDPARGIVARDLATGNEQTVVSAQANHSIAWFSIAPDGQTIAFNGATDGEETLDVQRLGEAPRELLRVKAPEHLRLQAWTPDGQSVLYTQGSRQQGLWLVPATGGAPRDLHVVPGSGVNRISVSPDGGRIAYPERVVEEELWITSLPLGDSRTAAGRARH